MKIKNEQFQISESHLFEGKEVKNKLIFLCTLKKLVDDFACFH